MRILLFVLLSFIGLGAIAQPLPPDEVVSLDEKSIPLEARKRIYSIDGLKPYTSMTPVFIYGDFDADGKPDLMVWVNAFLSSRNFWTF